MRPVLWRRWTGGWLWCLGTTSSPPSVGRSRRARTLEEMEFHWIDPECDAVLQAGGDENEAEKRLSIAGICCDPENLAAIKTALSPTEWEADAPYCTFRLPYQNGQPAGAFLHERGGAVQVSPLLGP